MKKKFLTCSKKTLSVFLAVLMLMTCWVFVPGEHNHAMAVSGTVYGQPEVYGKHYSGTTAAYGTPVFDGNTDRWFKWQNGDDWTTLYYPSNIYLDQSETLESAGYYFNVQWHFGDGSNYRIFLGSNVWGDNNGLGYNTSDGRIYAMNNIFSNYSVDASFPDGYYGTNDGGLYSSSNSNYDLRIVGYGYASQGSDGFDDNDMRHEKYVMFRSRKTTNNATIYLKGNPNSAYKGKTTEYNTSGDSYKSYGLAQNYKSGKWSKHDNGTKQFRSKGSDSSYYEGQWIEMQWFVTVYDKAALNNACTDANNYYNNNLNYSSYAKTWSTFTSARSAGNTTLTTRAVTQSDIDSKNSALVSANTNLKFAATNQSSLINKVNEAKAIQTKAGYSTLYTQTSRQALQTAIDAAVNNTLYTKVTEYHPGQYSDAGARAAADQNTINSLISAIDTAINGLERKYDIGYDNLFSFTDWVTSGSISLSNANGTIDYDATTGTVTVESTGTGEIYTTYSSNGYTMDVKPNTEYVFTAEMTTPAESTQKYGQMFIFCYDANGNSVNGPTEIRADGTEKTHSSQQHIGIYPTVDGVSTIKFRTPENCYKLRVRVGATASGVIETYSNIGVYEKEAYDAYAKNYTTVRESFTVGETKELSYKPTREGYVFDGWYKADGTKVTSTSGYSASDVVYAHWTEMYTVEFYGYDGNLITKAQVAPGTAATAPSVPSKDADENYEYQFDGWDKDFSNVTEDMKVTAKLKAVEHPTESLQYAIMRSADCEQNGWITKYCANCNYAWNDGNEYYDVNGEYEKASGHNYSKVVENSSTGLDGVHTKQCTNADCTYGENGGPATITEAHNFVADSTKDTTATCTVKGKTYYKCACLQEKEVEGVLDENNHVNTEIRGDYPAECEKEGYTGDKYCKDCGDKLEDGKAIDALEHEYTKYTYVEGSATCFADGNETATCDLCGEKTDTRTAAGTQLTHEYTAYTYNEGSAKCEVNGTETASCNHGCGTTNTREAANTALVHDYTGTAKDNGDGTHEFLCKNGCGTYGGMVSCSTWTENTAEGKCECTVCGYTKAHNWGDWETVGGSSTTAATQKRVCTDCKAEEAGECKYEVSVHKDATCEAAELTTYICSECKHGYTQIGKGPKGHNFTEEAGVKNHNNGTHSFYCVNNCGEYGFGTTKNASVACSEWNYANKEAGKHTATCKTCSFTKTEDCSGGTATCTAAAVCQYCNTSYGTTADHAYTGTEKYLYKATDATCTANETYYKYCIGCEVTSEDTDYEATYEKEGTMLPHTYTGNTWYDGAELAEEAKCEENEKYYVYCSVCKASSKGTDGEATFDKEGTALEHIWVDAQYNGEDTLKHTFTCERGCGDIMEASCMDSAVSFDSVPATCISEGYDVVQCTACSHTWNINYVPALGHDYTKKLRTEEYLEAAANCEHANIYWYACSRCERSAEDITEGEVYTGVKDENGQIVLSYLNGDVREHDWVMEVADEYLASGATCTAAAKYYYHCSYEDCDAKDTTRTFSNGSSLGHDFTEQITDDAHLVSAADCVNGSKYYYDCSRCEENAKDDANSADYIYELNDCAGHKMTHTAAVNANCDHAGNYEYWYCDTCKTYFKDVNGNEAYLGQSATVIKKRDHDIENVAYKAATCEQDGNPDYKYCKYDDCSYTTYPAVLPDGYKATGHNFTGAYTYDSVFNYHSKLCINGCGKSGMVVDGEQVEWNVTYNEDDVAVITGGVECDFTYKAETKDGVHSHANTCVCGNNSTKIYSDEETFVEKVAPNCTEKGYDSFKCPDEECGMTWKKNEVAALGHTAAATATSNGDGTHSVYCTVEGCGYKISTEKCSGGTATCKDKAVCSVCNTAYGETTGHTYTTEWVYQNDASCGVNGTEKNTCSVCNTEETREAKDTALKHDMIDELVYTIENWKDANGNSLAPEGFDVELKAPTCKDEGLAISYCKRCSYYQTKIQAKDTSAHAWDKDEDGELVWSVVGGDCATGVTLKNVCTVCGKSQTKTEEGKHSWILSFESRPTCVENGYRIWKCNVCDFTLNEHYGYNGELPEGYSNEDLAPLGEAGHKFVDTGVVKAATCSEPAKRVEKCLNCKVERYVDAEGSEALGHSLVHYEANDADCVYEGNVEHWVCGRCDAVYADEAGTQALESVVIPTKAHADNDGDGKCDECYRVLYTGDDGEGSCGCICHKDNFLMKILFKIVNFFWKLFKISKTCECGAVHW